MISDISDQGGRFSSLDFEEKNFVIKNNKNFIDLKKVLILNWILNKKKIIVKLTRRKNGIRLNSLN